MGTTSAQIVYVSFYLYFCNLIYFMSETCLRLRHTLVANLTEEKSLISCMEIMGIFFPVLCLKQNVVTS
jgi:hypothetical protein